MKYGRIAFQCSDKLVGNKLQRGKYDERLRLNIYENFCLKDLPNNEIC